LAINEANEFTKQHRATLEEEQAYYWMVKSVAAQFLDAKQSQTWVQMALGVHPDQSSQSTNFKNLEFKTFLEKFPQSKYFLEVQKLQQKAHHLLADHYLQIGLYYFKQKQWKAATGRFIVIIKTSAESPSFEPAVHYAILSFRQMAKDLRERKYSPARMRELMELNHDAPLNYELFAAQAESSAQTLRKVLQEKRPHSPWLTQL
jgi:outer membrane protein assembly factor BamD (BamD/ComL family)